MPSEWTITDNAMERYIERKFAEKGGLYFLEILNALSADHEDVFIHEHFNIKWSFNVPDGFKMGHEDVEIPCSECTVTKGMIPVPDKAVENEYIGVDLDHYLSTSMPYNPFIKGGSEVFVLLRYSREYLKLVYEDEAKMKQVEDYLEKHYFPLSSHTGRVDKASVIFTMEFTEHKENGETVVHRFRDCMPHSYERGDKSAVLKLNFMY